MANTSTADTPVPAQAVSSQAVAPTTNLKHKRRFCRIDGCGRIVKSQGLCQRHGATPRKCKVDGCDKQAQGNFDRMCKSHFKAMKRQTTPLPPAPANDTATPPTPAGRSVYDQILPASIRFVPTYETPGEESVFDKPQSKKAPKPTEVMPLIAHLKAGFDALKPPAWHRNEERLCRGLFPIHNPATQLEGWERELVWMEILVLTGAPGASFRHLARAWGRDKGFHMVLAQFICERQGDVERKKRQGVEAATSSDDAKQKSRNSKGAAAAAANGSRKRSALAAQPPPGAVAQRRLIRRGKSAGSVSSSSDGKTSEGGNVISVDIWDDSVYGHADYNEALAADIFNFSEKEVDSVQRRYKAAAAARKAGELDDDSEGRDEDSRNVDKKANALVSRRPNTHRPNEGHGQAQQAPRQENQAKSKEQLQPQSPGPQEKQLAHDGGIYHPQQQQQQQTSMQEPSTANNAALQIPQKQGQDLQHGQQMQVAPPHPAPAVGNFPQQEHQDQNTQAPPQPAPVAASHGAAHYQPQQQYDPQHMQAPSHPAPQPANNDPGHYPPQQQREHHMQLPPHQSQPATTHDPAHYSQKQEQQQHGQQNMQVPPQQLQHHTQMVPQPAPAAASHDQAHYQPQQQYDLQHMQAPQQQIQHHTQLAPHPAPAAANHEASHYPPQQHYDQQQMQTMTHAAPQAVNNAPQYPPQQQQHHNMQLEPQPTPGAMINDAGHFPPQQQRQIMQLAPPMGSNEAAQFAPPQEQDQGEQPAPPSMSVLQLQTGASAPRTNDASHGQAQQAPPTTQHDVAQFLAQQAMQVAPPPGSDGMNHNGLNFTQQQVQPAPTAVEHKAAQLPMVQEQFMQLARHPSQVAGNNDPSQEQQQHMEVAQQHHYPVAPPPQQLAPPPVGQSPQEPYPPHQQQQQHHAQLEQVMQVTAQGGVGNNPFAPQQAQVAPQQQHGFNEFLTPQLQTGNIDPAQQLQQLAQLAAVESDSQQQPQSQPPHQDFHEYN